MGHDSNHSRYPWGPEDICAPGLILPLLDERLWSTWFRTLAYFCTLLYFFIGIAIITQIFMTSIDRITSHTRKIYLANKVKRDGSSDSFESILKEDEPEIIEVRVWNDTVANLLLMAFGTASPEILLSIVETVAHNFESGKLGPSTIVGSAAFNLLIITSICILALPPGEIKKVHRMKVFLVTGLFSFFAYIWLLLILRYISPDVVELWEASITFILFPILIVFAYVADRDYFGFLQSKDMKRQLELTTLQGDGKPKTLCKANGEVDRENLIKFVKEVKKFPNLKEEEIALLAATKLVDESSRSANWHRINSVRKFTGNKNGQPVLCNKLKEVYEIIKNHPDGLKLGELPQTPESEDVSLIEFHCPRMAVKENIGNFFVTVWRHGNLDKEARVRIETIDGTAKRIEDYIPIREVLTFAPNEDQKKVAVSIVNDNKWEPDEEFFLRLTVVGKYADRVKLGQYSIMEVTIIDDEEPGIVSFEKRGIVVKESAGLICVPVMRTRGADGRVVVKWKTIDKTAIAGRDYVGGEGEVVFEDKEVKQKINIQIIDDMDPEKDEYFEIALFEPTNGAKIGNINRTLITISNDDDFNSVAHRLMLLTGANLDAIRVHTETWGEQFKLAMSVAGGDVENATTLDYVTHFFSFFWKVLFALVPPVAIFDGWLCFVVSLCVIGIMTTIIGDLATIFGCLIGLDDSLTAITIVALGTTLPDILGARMVSKAEAHADGALIHISGSIAVNVLIGVGVPWFVAAAYHAQKGTQFQVKSAGLEFSVLLFSVAAVLAALLLVLRRKLSMFGKAELGGPIKTRYLSAVILVSLWLLYLLFSFLQITHVIDPVF
ncbi:sodium/calcium exchanger Calx-like isoform X2 [Planococcus citri]|uniref:sodium/calcium exchanger Calx-like isoform X2 n=1 Tax=Planococcus citri TaxID=170843 RepID=UPI0031F7B104